MSIHDTLNRGYMPIKKQIIVANLNEKQYLCKKYIYGKKQNIQEQSIKGYKNGEPYEIFIFYNFL